MNSLELVLASTIVVPRYLPVLNEVFVVNLLLEGLSRKDVVVLRSLLNLLDRSGGVTDLSLENSLVLFEDFF